MYFETSAKTGENVESVFKAMCRLVNLKLAEEVIRATQDALPSMLKTKHVNLDMHQLTSIPNITNPSALWAQLETLSLQKNNIQNIDSIGECENLRALHLSHNSLKEIPKTITQLVKLELLDCSSNLISSIPSLKNLNKLRLLNLSHNKLTQIASEELSISIKELKLAGNMLTAIGTLQHSRIELLDLTENVLPRVPAGTHYTVTIS